MKPMNPEHRKRYEFAAYISIVCISLVLAAASTFIPWNTIANLALNLAASLLSVCLLFFLLNRFFLLPDMGSTGGETLLTTDLARETLDLNKRLGSAKSIDLLGYNLSSFLDEFRDKILSCVRRGGGVRILVINPNSAAGSVVKDNSRLESFSRNSDSTNELVHSYMGEQLQKERLPEGARLEFGRVNWIPSCSLVIVDRSLRKGVIKVAVNTPFYRTPRPRGRLNLLLKSSQDRHWFEFFADQFEELWRESVPQSLLTRSANGAHQIEHPGG